MKRTAHSLERRLIFRLTAILAASFLLFAAVYTLLIQNDAHFDAAEEVGELARDMAQTIHPLPNGRRGFDPASVAAVADWPAGSGYAAIDLATGAVVDGSSSSLLPAVQNRPGAQFSSTELVDRDGGLDVLAVERVDLDGARYRVAVVRPMSNGGIALTGLGYELADEILPTFLPSLLLAVLVTWVTIRVNLRPLRRASREAELISVDNPGQRMSTEGMASELVPMIAAVNRALDRLESGIAAQERFTANAAHELRTPLAVLRARVDGMAPGGERNALTRDIDRMTRAVSQMLLTARLQSHQMDATTPVDLVPLVRDVVADLAPLAHANGRDLVLDAVDRPRVTASAGALESAVRNLIENALRFSPVGEIRNGARRPRSANHRRRLRPRGAGS